MTNDNSEIDPSAMGISPDEGTDGAGAVLSRERPSGSVRAKLGLCLSGGGLRATFFHLGVLRRLAELDLLRQLSVISTVSGGSILGAHYLLRLKERLDVSPCLSADAYVALVDEVEADLRAGVRANLRNRLVWNPLVNLWMYLSKHGLGERMAKLYQRYLYRSRNPEAPAWTREEVPLRKLRIRIGQRSIEHHNQSGEKDRVPKLVINATTLNAGRNFRFTAVEVGDPILGFIRFNEAWKVVAYQGLLDALASKAPTTLAAIDAALQPLLARPPKDWPGFDLVAEDVDDTPAFSPRTRHVVALWLGVPPDAPRADPGFAPVIDFFARTPIALAALRRGEPGVLRRAKIAAWFAVYGPRMVPPLRGGLSPERQVPMLWDALLELEPHAFAALRAELDALPVELRDDALRALEEVVVTVYLLRSAETFSHHLLRPLTALTVPVAVACSANFPPLFAPFLIHDLYAPSLAGPLALTDGGVYDNQGFTALLEEGCTDVIASDAGGDLPLQPSASVQRLGMMMRMIEVFMGAIRTLELRSIRDRATISDRLARAPGLATATHEELERRLVVKRSAFFHMSSSVDGTEELVPAPLPVFPAAGEVAAIRTDLDAFTELEIDALIYQGYQLSDRFVRASGIAYTPPAARERPVDPRPVAWEVTASARKLLASGSARAFRFLAAWPRTQTALVAALGLAFVGLLALPAERIYAALDALRGLFSSFWAQPGLSVIAAHPVGAAKIWLGVVGFSSTLPLVEQLLVRRFPAYWGHTARGETWLGLIRTTGRFLPRLGWFAILLLPVWVSLGLAAFGAASVCLQRVALWVGAREAPGPGADATPPVSSDPPPAVHPAP